MTSPALLKWRGQASSWLLAIWHFLIAKSLFAIWQFGIAKALLTICCSNVAKFTLAIWQLCFAQSLLMIWHSCIAKWNWWSGNTLLLSSNNRISSIYWIRGSIHCFLTSFSHLNCYFLFLVFLLNCYLLVSLRLSWLHRNQISHHIFSYLWYSEVLHCTCAPIFLA